MKFRIFRLDRTLYNVDYTPVLPGKVPVLLNFVNIFEGNMGFHAPFYSIYIYSYIYIIYTLLSPS